MNLAWSEVIVPSEYVERPRVKRIQCAQEHCRVWHVPTGTGYCTPDCRRIDEKIAAARARAEKQAADKAARVAIARQRGCKPASIRLDEQKKPRKRKSYYVKVASRQKAGRKPNMAPDVAARAVAEYLSVVDSLETVGAKYGVSGSALCRAVKRMREALDKR